MKHDKIHQLKQPGLPPGTLVHVGKPRTGFLEISVLQYRDQDYNEFKASDITELSEKLEPGCVSWININGVHDAALIEKIGQVFGIHNLSLEDIMNTNSRAKLEEFEGYILLIVKDLYINEDETIGVEQISFLLKENVLITFQEEAGDVFEVVRNRIRTASTKIRTRGADYLAFALIDAIVDNYFIVTDRFDHDLEELEIELTGSSVKGQVEQIQVAKNKFAALRRSIVPMRELVFAMHKTENHIFKKKTHLYIRDLYDHATQVTDILEQSRDRVSGLMSIYISGTNNIMNNIMKTLTIISTIFMALSLIAGIYGMNFTFMPEKEWRYGYFIVLGVMALVALGLILYFRRKKWLD